MREFILYFSPIVIIGLGATLTFDLWGVFLKCAFRIAPSNICLVGRWIRYMPKGTFTHSNIASMPRKSAECAFGWIAHYVIGITFAIVFIAVMGSSWFEHPTLIPAVTFGIVTVVAPFFIMQPAFGLGLAASKTANPLQARLRSLMNHIAFGFGLYLFTLLSNWLLSSSI